MLFSTLFGEDKIFFLKKINKIRIYSSNYFRLHKIPNINSFMSTSNNFSQVKLNLLIYRKKNQQCMFAGNKPTELFIQYHVVL